MCMYALPLTTSLWLTPSHQNCMWLFYIVKLITFPLWLAVQFSSFQFNCCHVRLFATSRTVPCQASLSITNSWNLLKLISPESVMPSNHLILCHPLLLPSIFPSIRVFSNESAFHIRWPKYWSFSFSISPSSEYSGMSSFRMDWFDSLAKCRHRVISQGGKLNPTSCELP